jgi:hypothetical protein
MKLDQIAEAIRDEAADATDLEQKLQQARLSAKRDTIEVIRSDLKDLMDMIRDGRGKMRVPDRLVNKINSLINIQYS